MPNIQLDFSLSTDKERLNFLHTYTQNQNFTENELELMANYLLWGKDENGLNSVQRKEVDIPTKSKTWDRKETESLDNLLDNPSFCENLAIRSNVNTKKVKENFSREEALTYAPPAARESYLALFDQIDRLDLMLNYYDLKIGKRKNPPRQDLLDKFTPEEQQLYQQKADKLNPYRYLKLRHHLVDLRRQQFSIKDSYTSVIQHDRVINSMASPPPSFGVEVFVFPLGMNYGDNMEICRLVFREEKDIYPNNYSREEKQLLQSFLEEKTQKYQQYPSNFDFRDEVHVYNFLLNYYDLRDSYLEEGQLSTTKILFDTFEYYVEFCKFPSIYKEILALKIDKTSNHDIAAIVNQRYSKTYTANYISTIFKQKIIKDICDAAKYHFDLIESIFDNNNFKKCIDCGRYYLRDSRNFMKKSRSKDGFSNRCKCCEKIIRDRRDGKV